LKTGDGILKPACPVATSSAPWFFDGVGWFPLNGGQHPWENLGGTWNVDENKTG
jgi:hypothetical protein